MHVVRYVEVDVEAPNAFDPNDSTYQVNNMHLSGLRETNVDPITLYMRQEAKDLWKRLEESADNALIFVSGCPGVGKSLVVFAQTFLGEFS